jgi:hypothetical protein
VATLRGGARLRRMQLRVAPRALHNLRRGWDRGRVLLQRVHDDGEGPRRVPEDRQPGWGAAQVVNSVDPYSLKAPGFNPRTYEVKTWFQSLLSHATCTATPGQRQDGPVLRAQEVRVQEAMRDACRGGGRGRCLRVSGKDLLILNPNFFSGATAGTGSRLRRTGSARRVRCSASRYTRRNGVRVSRTVGNDYDGVCISKLERNTTKHTTHNTQQRNNETHTYSKYKNTFVGLYYSQPRDARV